MSNNNYENFITIHSSIEDLSDGSEIPGLTSSTSSSECSDSEMEESNEIDDDLELVAPNYLFYRDLWSQFYERTFEHKDLKQ